MDYQALKSKLADPWWRLNNLYYITDKAGKKVKFKPNWAQKALYDGMWYLSIVLKARQLGMTTFIQLFILDRCLFNENISAGVIAHTREDAENFFDKKIKFAYDNLPESLKDVIKATSDSARQLTFSNGSSIRVGTSLRSGTLQYLHVSEFGKVCAKYPDKAEEIITGSLNAVQSGQFVFIESTAEGAWGHFYEMCKTAQATVDHTALDFKFFFYPWHEHPDYVLNEPVDIPDDLKTYFSDLERKGIALSPERQAWYTKKRAVQKTKMKQEFPSTPDEAFEVISELAVYGAEIGDILRENRYTRLPVTGAKPVHLFFDLGKSSKSPTTAVWFMQDNSPWYDFVDYYQAPLQVVGDYVRDIKARGYNLGRWYIPHDAEHKDYAIKSFKDRLIEAGVKREDIVIVPRVAALTIGIDLVKEMLPKSRFDSDRAKEGFDALRAYRYDYDERLSKVISPVHDWASHCCFVGGTLITTDRGAIPIESVTTEDQVWTPEGWQPVAECGLVKIASDLIEIELSNGTVLTATPDHKLFTTGGLVRSDAISYNDALIVSQEASCLRLESASRIGYRAAFTESFAGISFGTGRSEGFTSRRKAASNAYCTAKSLGTDCLRLFPSMATGITSIQTTGSLDGETRVETSRASTNGKSSAAQSITESLKAAITRVGIHRSNICTALCGCTSMARYLKGITSTISTAISQTTGLKTSILSLPVSTQGITAKIILGLGLKKTSSSFVRPPRKLKCGTQARKAERGIASMEEIHGKAGSLASGRAMCAGSNTKHTFRVDQSIAASVVSLRRIQKANEPVYDLTIPLHHCYYANGVLVSNCDALRQCAQGYKQRAEELDPRQMTRGGRKAEETLSWMV